jgi:hypothetical protein
VSSTGTPFDVRELVPRTLLAEVAAYVGAPAAAAAAGVIVARSSLGTTGRVLVAVLFVAVFLAVGFAVGEGEDRIGRLRSVMWFGAVLAWFALVQVLVFDVAGLGSRTAGVVASILAAAGAGAVWWLCRRSLQQVALFLTLVAIVTAIAFPTPSLSGFDTTTIGVLVWLLGLAWLVLGARGVIVPRRTALVLGTVSALLAPVYLLRTGSSIGGEVLGFITAIALFVAGGRFGDRAVEGLAIVGLAVISSVVVAEHLRDPEELALVALLVGLGLLAVAVWLARPRPDLPFGGGPSLSAPPSAPRTLDQPPAPPTAPDVPPPAPGG